MECVICGGRSFGPGPGGRLAANASMPQCVTCHSLERHRAIRKFFNDIFDSAIFSTLDVLQFSRDPAIEDDWFHKYEYSIYNGHNSLDLQRIDRPDETYHLVICNHVLEHVPDDSAALRELMRIVRNDGVVFLTVPAPLRRKQTIDWGFADERRHGHYREYGADITDSFNKNIPNAIVHKVSLDDSCTGSRDVGFILTNSVNKLLNHIRDKTTTLSFC